MLTARANKGGGIAMAMCSHLALFLAQAPSFVTSKRARLPGHVGNRKSRDQNHFRTVLKGAGDCAQPPAQKLATALRHSWARPGTVCLRRLSRKLTATSPPTAATCLSGRKSCLPIPPSASSVVTCSKPIEHRPTPLSAGHGYRSIMRN